MRDRKTILDDGSVKELKILEVLLDIRDAMVNGHKKDNEITVETVEAPLYVSSKPPKPAKRKKKKKRKSKTPSVLQKV